MQYLLFALPAIFSPKSKKGGNEEEAQVKAILAKIAVYAESMLRSHDRFHLLTQCYCLAAQLIEEDDLLLVSLLKKLTRMLSNYKNSVDIAGEDDLTALADVSRNILTQKVNEESKGELKETVRELISKLLSKHCNKDDFECSIKTNFELQEKEQTSSAIAELAMEMQEATFSDAIEEDDQIDNFGPKKFSNHTFDNPVMPPSIVYAEEDKNEWAD